MNLFEKASREKLRFITPRGMMSVEDLWDLPLVTKNPNNPSLNSIAQHLHHQIASATPSFVKGAGTAMDPQLQLSLEIVVHVIEVRQAEAEVLANAARRKAEKQKLLEILDQKQDEELKGLSADEIKARIDAL